MTHFPGCLNAMVLTRLTNTKPAFMMSYTDPTQVLASVFVSLVAQVLVD